MRSIPAALPENPSGAATAGSGLRRTRTGPARVAAGVVTSVVASLVAGLLPALPVLPAQAATNAPTVSEVKSSHPRLLESSSGFTALASRVKTDPTSADLYATVVKEADAMLSAPVVRYSKPDGVRLLDTSRTVLDRSYTLMVAYKVSGKAKYADRLKKDLDAAAAFPDWNPNHFLDTAEMTQAFAIAYDWGYGHWDSAERSRLRSAIVTKGLTPSLKVYRATSVDATPYTYGGNWAMRSDNVNIVVNSAMATGALAVARDTSSSVPQQVLDESFDSLRTGLRAYGPDGGFAEGPTYWDYATRYLTTFLGSLRTATGSYHGLTGTTGLAQTASFMQAMTGPGGQYYGFGDSITSFQPAASYAGLASIYGDANRMALAASAKSSAFAPLQLVLRNPGLAARGAAPASAPLQSTFSAAGVTSMRGSRTDARASYAAFRFRADPAGPHQHLDAGDFDFQALGQEWALDLGMDNGTYDLQAENRSSTRWNYYRTRAEGHNTLAIDPFKPGAGSKTATTRLVKKGSDVDSAYAVADLSAAYPGEVSSWKRGVRLFDDRSQLLVQDEITAPGNVEALWSMHTGADVRVASGGRSAVLYQNGERVLARIVSPGQTFVRMAAAPLPTSPKPKQTANTGVSKLAIMVRGSKAVTVAVQLTPLRRGSSTSSTPGATAVRTLSTWGVAGANAPLSSLTVDKVGVPGFRADQASYTVPVRSGRVPVVAATAPKGSVSVQQATSVPGRARVTVSGNGPTTTYVVHLEPAALKISRVSTSSTSAGWGSATFDGKLSTYWAAHASTATATWELAKAADVDSALLSWRANSAKKVVFSLSTSNDKKSWSTRYSGRYVGGSGTQGVKLSSGSSVRYVRLTVHGDGGSVKDSLLNEVQLFDYDARKDLPGSAASRPSAVSLSGVPSSIAKGELAPASRKVTWTGSAGTASYRYVSANPAVASVDASGVVTGRGAGSTSIGVLATSGGTTVTSSVPVAVVVTTKVRIYADADTYVQSTTSGSNYGDRYGMLVKRGATGKVNRVGYLHFDLTRLKGKTVTSAVLGTESVITDTLTSPSTQRVDLQTASGSWKESTLTYGGRPSLGGTIGSFVAGRTKKVTQANVTGAIAAAAKKGTTGLTVGMTQADPSGRILLTTVSSRESGKGAYLDVVLRPAPLAVSGAVASATTSGSAKATVDGDPSTAWRTDSNPGWVRWQLASSAHVASTTLSWKANSAKKTVFEVETSKDTKTWTRRYAGQYVGASGNQTVSLGSGVRVNYVRLVVHGNGGSVKTSMLNDVKLLGYDATAASGSAPSTVLGSVSVGGLSSTLAKGTSTQARAAVLDTTGRSVTGAGLSWSSSNPAVATVSSTGVVKAVATGSATITTRASANGVTVTGSVTVKVVDPNRVRLYVTADTYVESSTPTRNYGKEHGMLVKPAVSGKANRVAYLRFDTSALAGKKVTSARLSTESVIADSRTSPSSVRVHAHSASGSWSEMSLTYGGRPTLGGTLGSFVATRTKARTSTDLTSALQTLASRRTSSLTLGLTEDGAGTSAMLVNVTSKEAPSGGAYIDVVLG
jgi:uncharacterized protein YjdB